MCRECHETLQHCPITPCCCHPRTHTHPTMMSCHTPGCRPKMPGNMGEIVLVVGVMASSLCGSIPSSHYTADLYIDCLYRRTTGWIVRYTTNTNVQHSCCPRLEKAEAGDEEQLLDRSLVSSHLPPTSSSTQGSNTMLPSTQQKGR